MVPFGGWDMPVQYAGLRAEHEAVRTSAGVFDVSHMGEFRITGPDALKFLQHVTPNDVSKLRPGRAHYNWLPNDRGGLVDDIYIYMVAENEYLMVVNAGNIDKAWAHLNALTGGFDVKLANESDQWALLAVGLVTLSGVISWPVAEGQGWLASRLLGGRDLDAEVG